MSETKNTNYKKKKIEPQNSEIQEAFVLASEDTEKIVLGTLLGSRDCEIAFDMLSEDSFYFPRNRMIAKAIFRLFSARKPIDLLIVSQELRKSSELDYVGLLYIGELLQKTSSSVNLEYHCLLLQEYETKRKLKIVSSDMAYRSSQPGEDVFELLTDLETQIANITDSVYKGQSHTMHALVTQNLKMMEENMKSKGGLRGPSTGFRALDRLLYGWGKSDLIIVAARPAMGKTAYSLQSALRAAKLGIPVGFFSLEMSAAQLTTRLICAEASVSYEEMLKGLTPKQYLEVQNATQLLATLPIHICDDAGLNITQFRAKARKMVREFGVQEIMLDYLQLMQGTRKGNNANRENEISEISRGLKMVAKELDIPVVALSQLSRGVETRGGDKRPQLSDLRESGAIEQDADTVLFLYRPEYYGIEVDAQNNSTKNRLEIICAKNRHGGLDTVWFDVFLKYFQVFDYSEAETYRLADKPTFINERGYQEEIPSNFKPDDPFSGLRGAFQTEFPEPGF